MSVTPDVGQESLEASVAGRGSLAGASMAVSTTQPAPRRAPATEDPPLEESPVSVLIADSGDGVGAVLADRIANHLFDARVATGATDTLAAFTRSAYDVVLLPAFVEETTVPSLIAELRALPGGATAVIAPYTMVPSSFVQASYLAAGADRIITLPAATEHLRLIILGARRRLQALTELGVFATER